MKRCLALAIVVMSSPAILAQTPEVVDKVEAKLATIRYVNALYDPATGGFKVVPDGKPSLRACNGAAKALAILGAKLPDKDKTAAFVLGCYDPKTGAFAEPGGKPDVTITSVGVMVAMELGIPKEKFAKAMEYLKENAKTFEDVRIAAAAVEAWGVKECPFELKEWQITASGGLHTDRARDAASALALLLRLNLAPLREKDLKSAIDATLRGQSSEGGWSRPQRKLSDLESTYRVMRALMLLKHKPMNSESLRAFIGRCRNKDGGYGVEPGEPSSMSGVYYATIITKWIADLEKKN